MVRVWVDRDPLDLAWLLDRAATYVQVHGQPATARPLGGRGRARDLDRARDLADGFACRLGEVFDRFRAELQSAAAAQLREVTAVMLGSDLAEAARVVEQAEALLFEMRGRQPMTRSLRRPEPDSPAMIG